MVATNIFISIIFINQMIRNTFANLLLNDCSNASSCSPSWCKFATNAACVDPNANANPETTIQQSIQRLGCTSCIQSTSSKCSSAYLNSVLKG